MSYIEKHLLQQEEIRFTTTPSKRRNIFMYATIFFIFLMGVIMFFTDAWWLTILFIFFVIVLLFYTFPIHYEEYSVTNKRIVLKYWFIRTHATEIMAKDIVTMSINRGIFDVFFKSGQMVLITNSWNRISFDSVDNYEEFRSAIYALREDKER